MCPTQSRLVPCPEPTTPWSHGKGMSCPKQASEEATSNGFLRNLTVVHRSCVFQQPTALHVFGPKTQRTADVAGMLVSKRAGLPQKAAQPPSCGKTSQIQLFSHCPRDLCLGNAGGCSFASAAFDVHLCGAHARHEMSNPCSQPVQLEVAKL